MFRFFLDCLISILRLIIIIIELICYFSGLKSVWRKILPANYEDAPENRWWRKIFKTKDEFAHDNYEDAFWWKILKYFDRKPQSTFLLWFVGIYVALFGIASQRYENRIDIIENGANAIFAQLSTPAWRKAISRIPRVQNMTCPTKPDILNPSKVINSFISESYYIDICELLKETIEVWKNSLDSVDLFGAYLCKADLSGANLRRADLSRANLSGADLTRAKLTGANLVGANLVGATGLTKDQLLKVDKLYKVKGLDEELEKQLKEEAPQLFEKPELYKEPDEDE